MIAWTTITTLFVGGVGSGAGVGAVAYYRRQATVLKAQLDLQAQQSERLVLAQRANNDLLLMGHALALDRLFIDTPALRPYFYDGAEPPTDDSALRAQVFATAELVIDFADMVANAIRLEQLDSSDAAAWEIAVADYGRSPAVRLIASHNDGAWRPHTLELLLQNEPGKGSLSADSAQ